MCGIAFLLPITPSLFCHGSMLGYVAAASKSFLLVREEAPGAGREEIPGGGPPGDNRKNMLRGF
jgi:hypothetical protein